MVKYLFFLIPFLGFGQIVDTVGGCNLLSGGTPWYDDGSSCVAAQSCSTSCSGSGFILSVSGPYQTNANANAQNRQFFEAIATQTGVYDFLMSGILTTVVPGSYGCLSVYVNGSNVGIECLVDLDGNFSNEGVFAVAVTAGDTVRVRFSAHGGNMDATSGPQCHMVVNTFSVVVTGTSPPVDGGGSDDCLECCQDLEALLTAIDSDTSYIVGTQLPQLIESLDNVEVDIHTLMTSLTQTTSGEGIANAASAQFTSDVNSYSFDGPVLVKETVAFDIPALGNIGSGQGSLDVSGGLVVPLSDFNSQLTAAGVMGNEQFSDFTIPLVPESTTFRSIVGICILLIGGVVIAGFVWKAII